MAENLKHLGLTHQPPETLQIAFQKLENTPAGLASALAYTQQLTHSHYENFSVVSCLLPKHLRQDFCNIYAFCRVADDLGDEAGNPQKAQELLAGFEQQTHDMFAGKVETAVFLALWDTVQRFAIPIEPFLNLISAFQQDQVINRYENYPQVLDYCRRSADPVGRLVLYLCGYRDELRQQLSDKTCTALQLTNFWQDVRRDILERDRIYLPADSLAQFGVTIEQIKAGHCTDNYRQLLAFEVARTEKLFDEGAQLLPMLDVQYRGQIALFGKGGRGILDAIKRQKFDTLSRRPSLSKWQKGKLILGVLTQKWLKIG